MAAGFWRTLHNLFKAPHSGKSSQSDTPTDAVMEARRSMIRRKLPEDLSKIEMCLTDFENTATFDRFKTKANWTLKFHREVMEAYIQEINKRGGSFRKYVIENSPYQKWLDWNGLANSDNSQTKYVQWLQSKESK